jgi:hypothetical protein
MGQPVRGCHRPARHRGLTSPDPVTALRRPKGLQQTASLYPGKTLDKPQDSERQQNHAHHPPQDQHCRASHS